MTPPSIIQRSDGNEGFLEAKTLKLGPWSLVKLSRIGFPDALVTVSTIGLVSVTGWYSSALDNDPLRLLPAIASTCPPGSKVVE